MNQNDMHDLLIGAVLIVLGYAIYQHFKPQTSSLVGFNPATQSTAMPTLATPVTDTANDSMVHLTDGAMTLSDLLYGSVSDRFKSQ